MRKIKHFNIKRVQDVRDFFNWITTTHNIDFHPDTDFRDYNIFTKLESDYLNTVMDHCFLVCDRFDIDVYEIGLEYIK